MKVRHLLVRIVGYALMGLLLGGSFGVAVVAALRNQPYVWENYWGAPITALGAVITFGAMGVIGAIWLVQRLGRRLRRDAEREP